MDACNEKVWVHMMKRCGWMCMMKKCGCTWREGMDAHNEKVGMYVMRWGCM